MNILQQIDMAKKLGYNKIFINREEKLYDTLKSLYNLGQKTNTQ